MLGVPCNQFGNQEPGSNAEILEFATSTYDVNFPLLAKVDVNGPDEAPLYTLLKSAQPGDGDSADITWNFEKFVVDGDGKVTHRFAPTVTPEQVAEALGR